MIIPMIDDLMRQAQIGYRDLSRIAVTTGPGTFTGIRVGIAAARGLALAADVPVVSCSSLQVLAAAERQLNFVELTSSIAVIADARRDQVYFAHYGQHGEEVIAPCLVSMNDVYDRLSRVSPLSSRKVVIVGSAAPEFVRLYSNEAISLGNSKSMPDAAVLVEMAAGLPVLARPVRPLYLRKADAKPQAGKSILRQV